MILHSVDKSNYSLRDYAADEDFILLTRMIEQNKIVFLLLEIASIVLSRETPFIHGFLAMRQAPSFGTIISFENLRKKLI